MEKKAIDHLEGIYREELDSHDIRKAFNNIDNIPINSNNYFFKKKQSSRNVKSSQDSAVPLRNTLIFKNKNSNKDSINIFSFKPKESHENLFVHSNSEKTKKEEEKMEDLHLKTTKPKNIGLKVCKTLKNCGENINNAKLLIFDKSNNNKQSIKLTKNFSNKNCFFNNKRGSLFQMSKRHRKLKEKDSSENFEIVKKKKIRKPYNSNNKLLYFTKNNIIQAFDNCDKDNSKYNNNQDNYNQYNNNQDNNNKENIKHYIKENNVYLFSQIKRKRTKSNNIKHYITSNSNRYKTKRIFNSSGKEKHDNEKNKKRTSNKNLKNNQEIIYDTDNEVENNILCLLDKSFKKRNSVVNNQNKKQYCTQELVNDKLFKNFHNSIPCKNRNSKDIGKISNFSNISIIKKTEFNHYDINNNDDSDFFQENTKKKGPKFKGISTQKVVSFEYKDNNEDNKNEDNIFYTTKNKRKKKVIIYNNINYYKTTQKEDNNDIILHNEDNNEENNDILIYSKKNSFSNNNYNNHCGCPLFNCCFLLD